MRNIRWQLLIAAGGLVLVVGLLLGQSPGIDPTSPQPMRGGAYSEALIGSLLRLNPVLDNSNQADRDIDSLLFSGLVRFDDHGLPTPDIAESWSISADATLFTFSLRDDAFWHDGESITSDDVVYTFSKLQDEGYPGPAELHELWKEINIIQLDEHTVQFQLPEPFAPFLDYLTIGLLPDHLLRGVSVVDMVDHPYNLQPIGTGPFRFDHFIVEDDEIVGVYLIAFSDYYDGAPYLERVEFRYFPDARSALDAYLAGEVMGISNVTPEILTEVLQDPNLNLHSTRLPKMGIVFLNIRHPEKEFLADRRVRQALLMAVNRQWLIDQAINGQAIAAHGPILPDTWAYAQDLPIIPFDPELAAELLTSAGWELPVGAAPGSSEYVRQLDEQTLSFELAYPDDPMHAAVADILQSSWASVGASVELIAVDHATLLTDYLQAHEYQAVLTELNLIRSPDPDPYPFWHDTQIDTGQNYSGFSDRNVSIWLERARTIPDILRRADSYRHFQHRFQDQIPALLLYYPIYNYALDTQVQGVSIGLLLDPSDRFANISSWFMLASRNLTPTPEDDINP
ncbi:MAG: ABC transporter substrate-binding protein [Anaerolineales bacterium]|jgi:peptide/nickel transport system substrate-binding protein